MATHFSVLAWEIPWTGEAWQAAVHGVTKSWARLSDYHTLNSSDTSVMELCSLPWCWHEEASSPRMEE